MIANINTITIETNYIYVRFPKGSKRLQRNIYTTTLQNWWLSAYLENKVLQYQS